MEEENQEFVKEYYSVGGYGPFPISFYKIGDEYYYIPMEHDTEGPFDSLGEAVKQAEIDFGMTDGGFYESLEDAEKHAEWMREQGYGIE